MQSPLFKAGGRINACVVGDDADVGDDGGMGDDADVGDDGGMGDDADVGDGAGGENTPRL